MIEVRSLLQKLRWATLGYHHNWDTKVYNENSHDPFPEDLAKLSQYVAKVVGFKDFSAEAAIVNYYHMDSTLSGHTDHSEKNKEAPLFSFSFGQSAIFLIGGPSLEEKPIALLIDSGDIIIMSGGSRLCYHGIPRILPTNKAPWSFLQQEEYEHDGYNDCSVLENVKDGVKGEVKHSREELSHCVDNELWEPYGTYLKTSRINMNVRQVLQPGEKFLPH